MATSSHPDEIEVEIVMVFKINAEAWATEYGVDLANVPEDMAAYHQAPDVKKAFEDVRILGPLVTNFSSVKVRVGKGPKAILSES